MTIMRIGKQITEALVINGDKFKKKFEELGYKFIHLWETDIKTAPKKIRNKLKRYLG
jgi:hypothetical protein